MNNPYPLPFARTYAEELGMSLDAYLDAMVAGYLECIDFTEQPLEEHTRTLEISTRGRLLAEAECQAFLHLSRWHVNGWSPSQLGHDF